MGIALIKLIILSSTLYFIIEIKWLVVIYMFFTSSLIASPFCLIPAGIQEVFGVKFSSEIYGMTYIAFAFSSFLVPILGKVFDICHAVDTKPYLYINLMGTCTGIIGLVTLFCLSLKPYFYQYY